MPMVAIRCMGMVIRTVMMMLKKREMSMVMLRMRLVIMILKIRVMRVIMMQMVCMLFTETYFVENVF